MPRDFMTSISTIPSIHELLLWLLTFNSSWWLPFKSQQIWKCTRAFQSVQTSEELSPRDKRGWELSCSGSPRAKYGGQLRWRERAKFSSVNEHENMLVLCDCIGILKYNNFSLVILSSGWIRSNVWKRILVVAFVKGVYCMMWATVWDVIHFSSQRLVLHL